MKQWASHKNTLHAHPHRSADYHQRGFTIVELLIVIIVIGILATLVLVAYSNVSDQAKATAAKNDLEQIVKQLNVYKENTGGGSSYPADSSSLSYSSGTTVQYLVNNTVSPATFCVSTTNGNGTFNATNTANAPAAGSCAVSAYGALGWWKFNGNATDSSGNGLNGTVSGATLTTGQNGSANTAYSFDGSTNYIYMPAASFNANSFAVSAWFKSTLNGDRKIFSTAVGNPLQMWTGGSLRTCSITCTPGTGNYADGAWHQAVVTGDATSVRVYIDGNTTPNITASANNVALGGNLQIGRDIVSGNYYYGGVLDDIRLFGRTLSTTDVQALYAAGAQ